MTTTIVSRRSHVLAGIAMFAAALAATAAGAVALSWPFGDNTSPARPVPEWFAPIAKSYGNNPRVTPKFDFASLYAPYPLWFERIARSYGYDPAVTPDFDFAALYGPPELETR